MPQLSEFQQTFRDCILDQSMEAMMPAVNDCKIIPIEQRLNVYHNNVLSSLREVLKEIFPRLVKLGSEDYFKALAHTFITRHPPVSGCLLEYGAKLPEFMKEFAPDHPYFTDVAALEWYLNEAYYEADADNLVVAKLQNIPPEQYPKLSFKFLPSARFLVSKFPLQKIWELIDGEADEQVDISQGSAHVLVIRPKAKVEIFWLQPATYDLLFGLYQGHSLGKACKSAYNTDPDFNLSEASNMCIEKEFFCDVQK